MAPANCVCGGDKNRDLKQSRVKRALCTELRSLNLILRTAKPCGKNEHELELKGVRLQAPDSGPWPHSLVTVSLCVKFKLFLCKIH